MLGEISKNTYGTEMKIVRDGGYDDVDVEFLDEHHYIKEHCLYSNFKRGTVKNPYDRTIFGVGYIGVGEHKTGTSKKHSKECVSWKSMLSRCYRETDIVHEAYADCEVCEEWHDFQKFGDWFDENYYECDERLHVDKDIRYPGNRIYSPQNCILIPQSINAMLINKPNKRGLPNGIYAKNGKYEAKYYNDSLGLFDTIIEAFNARAKVKEEAIRNAALSMKNIIPIETLEIILNYKVLIENDKNYCA